MRVEAARYRDIRAWLDLAAEVEPLFGPLLDDAGFYQALLSNIERGTAFCVREEDGPAGTALAGGLLFSPSRPDRPEHRIAWLAVAGAWRRRGVGQALVAHVVGLLELPATLAVITFGDEVTEDGLAARRFYERLGFRPAEPAPVGPDGGSRQVYRLDRYSEESDRSHHGNMTYHIYENWMANGHQARVHCSTCSFCRNGAGVHPGSSNRNGQWHGPYASLAEALAVAGQTGRVVSQCRFCRSASR